MSNKKVAVRNSKMLRLRRSPYDGASIDGLPGGTELEVIAEQRWLQVKDPHGRTGWVLGDYVDPVSQESTDSKAETLEIVHFHHQRFFSDAPIQVHRDFVDSLEGLGELLEDELRIYITSSLRKPNQVVKTKVVEPASRSNHYVGHAVDFNLVSNDGEWFNSKRLANLSELPPVATRFIRGALSYGLRWGGHFEPPDPIHLDDGLNIKDPEQYQSIYDSLWK